MISDYSLSDDIIESSVLNRKSLFDNFFATAENSNFNQLQTLLANGDPKEELRFAQNKTCHIDFSKKLLEEAIIWFEQQGAEQTQELPCFHAVSQLFTRIINSKLTTFSDFIHDIKINSIEDYLTMNDWKKKFFLG